MFWLYEIWYENWFWPNKCEYHPSFADDVVIVFKQINKTWGLVTLSSTIVAYNHMLWAAKINDSYERTWWNESDVKCIERCYIFGTKYMLFYTNFDETAYIWYIIDITIKEVVVNFSKIFLRCQCAQTILTRWIYFTQPFTVTEIYGIHICPRHIYIAHWGQR